METWLAADPNAVASHFRISAGIVLPSTDLESRNRHEVLSALRNATNDRYRKGSVAFEVLGKVDPSVLRSKLLHFDRFIDTLDSHA